MVVVVVPACSMFNVQLESQASSHEGCVFGRRRICACIFCRVSRVSYPLVHNFNSRMDGCQLSAVVRNIRAVIAALVIGAVLVAAASVVCSVCSPSEAAAAANQ